MMKRRTRPRSRRTPSQNPLAEGRRVMKIESDAVRGAAARLNSSFVRAVHLIQRRRGKVVVTGMGKSGLIGRKIVATLNSTGTPAIYLHPAEAGHGDLGAVTLGDVVLAISLSGETREIIDLLPALARLRAPVIAMTGNASSSLAAASETVLDIGVRRESCPLNLAPTASCATTLAMGDALAMVLMKRQGFDEDDFASVHPQGSLGKRVLARVSQFMHGGGENPALPVTARFGEALNEITRKRLGAVSVVDRSGRLAGLVTDGDIRRLIGSTNEPLASLRGRRISAVMRVRPTHVRADSRAADAMKVMRAKAFNVLPVVDQRGVCVGMLHVHDLLRAGF